MQWEPDIEKWNVKEGGQTVTNIEGNVWRTSDYVLVSYLSTQLIYHNDIKRIAPSVYFYFENSPQLEGVIETYEQRGALVEPIRFASVMRETMRTIRELEKADR